jgi:PHD/YefM family antitoxin component YafN of YafNO toxin-antitoxin module
MKDTNWNIAEAKQKFSDVVRQAAREPQAIYNRDRLVAVVVDAGVFQEFQAWCERHQAHNLHDSFAELRALFDRDEADGLEIPPRQDRPNAMLGVLNERAR